MKRFIVCADATRIRATGTILTESLDKASRMQRFDIWGHSGSRRLNCTGLKSGSSARSPAIVRIGVITGMTRMQRAVLNCRKLRNCGEPQCRH
jgi:hypothetical protein